MNPKKAFDYENDENENDNIEKDEDVDSVIEVTRTSTAPKRTARRSPASDETEKQQPAAAQSARTQSPVPNQAPNPSARQTAGQTARRPAPNGSGMGAGSPRRKKRRRVPRPIGYFGRTMLVIFTVIFIVIFALFAVLKTVATGPSETLRDMLVLSAMQASATKWVPYLFLDSETVDEILASAEVTQTDVISMDSYTRYTVDTSESTGVSYPDDTGSELPGDETGDVSGGATVDTSSEWDSAIDGMLYTTVSSSTYKAYILIIKDPSRVYVGTSSDFQSGQKGTRIFDIVAKEGAVAAINGGEFEDTGGQGTGDNPMGLTYSKGECVWNDGAYRTFIGFDSDNNLVVANSMSKTTADSLGIRDGVSFQTGNMLISNDGENVTVYYADANTGTSQRTAIGQRADGAVIMIVTDGRTASSIGATRNDIIDLLVSLGAVTAGMLDGGSSAMMYYEDYFTKYGIDTSYLDSYQLQGLCNVYKAFTTPRRLPTFFLVSPEE